MPEGAVRPFQHRLVMADAFALAAQRACWAASAHGCRVFRLFLVKGSVGGVFLKGVCLRCLATGANEPRHKSGAALAAGTGAKTAWSEIM